MHMRLVARQILVGVSLLLLASCQSSDISEFSTFGDSAASVKNLPDVS